MRALDAAAAGRLRPAGARSSPGVEVEFINAGHLLGSAYARDHGRREDDPVRRRSRPLRPAGAAGSDDGRRSGLPAGRIDLRRSRARARRRRRRGWRAIISDTVEPRRQLIIPAFAIGRVEEVLYWLKRLEEEGRIPVLPVFVDSPMAIDALARYTERLRELDAEMQPEERDDKAPHGPAAHERAATPASAARAQGAPGLRVLHRALPDDRVAAGVEGAHQLEDAGDRHLVERHGHRRPGAASSARGAAGSRNTVLFVGYQAVGTRGRQLVDGAKSGQDPRPDRAGRTRRSTDRFDVRPCRLQRDHALAVGLPAPAAHDLHRPRRADRDAGAASSIASSSAGRRRFRSIGRR